MFPCSWPRQLHFSLRSFGLHTIHIFLVVWLVCTAAVSAAPYCWNLRLEEAALPDFAVGVRTPVASAGSRLLWIGTGSGAHLVDPARLCVADLFSTSLTRHTPVISAWNHARACRTPLCLRLLVGTQLLSSGRLFLHVRSQVLCDLESFNGQARWVSIFA